MRVGEDLLQNPYEISVVLTFFNEERNAEAICYNLLHELDKHKISGEVVVVNNGSTDKTKDILNQIAKGRENVKVVNITKNLGYGWGLINGLKNAGGDYLAYMWGDGQVSPRYLTELFKTIKSNSAVLGKVERVTRNDGLIRKIISVVYNKIMYFVLGLNIKDINGTPKIVTRQAYETLRLNSKDWFIDAEIVFQLKDAKMVSIPAVMEARKEGKSNVHFGTIIEFVKNILKFKLQLYRKLKK